MLYNIPEFTSPKRVQGALISDSETNKVCDFLRKQQQPTYDEEVVSQPVQLSGRGALVTNMDDGDDEAWKDALKVVAASGKASTSLLQRKLRIGYGRASRLMDQMEEQGIIGPAHGAKPREVLIRDMDEVFNDSPQPAAVAKTSESQDIYDEIPLDET